MEELLGLVQVASGTGDQAEVALGGGLSLEVVELAVDGEGFLVELLGFVQVVSGFGDVAEVAQGGGAYVVIFRGEFEQASVLLFGGGRSPRRW